MDNLNWPMVRNAIRKRVIGLSIEKGWTQDDMDDALQDGCGFVLEALQDDETLPVPIAILKAVDHVRAGHSFCWHPYADVQEWEGANCPAMTWYYLQSLPGSVVGVGQATSRRFWTGDTSPVNTRPNVLPKRHTVYRPATIDGIEPQPVLPQVYREYGSCRIGQRDYPFTPWEQFEHNLAGLVTMNWTSSIEPPAPVLSWPTFLNRLSSLVGSDW